MEPVNSEWKFSGTWDSDNLLSGTLVEAGTLKISGVEL